MKASGLALVIACSTATTSYAKDARLEGILGHLEPSTRLEQLCGFEAMKRIRNDQPSLHPDRAVIDAVSGATLSGNTAKGSGGAFRSGGHWYHFVFKCEATADHMKILSFDYQIGSLVPESEWASYGLWR